MSKQKEPKANIWDRRPWPKIGDPTVEVIYEAVGRALSSWEIYEGLQSVLFSAFVTPNLQTKAAMRAYSAVRTFEGRNEMLRAASQAYFHEQPETELQDAFKGVLSTAASFSPRRNEITHASVNTFTTDEGSATDTFALYPAYASFRERDMKNIPTYCMTKAEIDYFSAHFREMQTPVRTLVGQITSRPYKRA
ncbi:hypothetical protein V1281_006899 [Nitrobacteraceae bacterium AZCC 2161]